MSSVALSEVLVAPALPPDVRRWLRPAVEASSTFGLCPRSDLWPNKLTG